MKYILSILFVLIFLSITYSQNWRAFNSKRVSFYKFYCQNTILPKFGKFSYVYYPEQVRTEDGDSIIFLKGSSANWAGNKIIANDTSETVFLHNSDTVFIKLKPLAKEGSSWDFCKNKIMASVTGFNTITILGLIDSVKTITLINKQDGAYLSEISLSKNYGLVSTIHFGLLIPNPNPNWINKKTGIQTLVLEGIESIIGKGRPFVKDIYDFDIGDEFGYIGPHYDVCDHYPNCPTYNTITTVVGKVFDADSVKYTFIKLKKTCNINNDRVRECSTELSTTTSKINLNERMHLLSSPEYQFCSGDPSSNNFSDKNNLTLNDSLYSIDYFLFEGGYQTIYKKGLGLVLNSSINTVNEDVYFQSQVYYKKGNKTWGSKPDIILATEEKATANFTIYPNPSSGTFKISWPGPRTGTIIIYDVSMKKIAEKLVTNVSETEFVIDVVQPGLYFLNITGDGASRTEKVLILK